MSREFNLLPSQRIDAQNQRLNVMPCEIFHTGTVNTAKLILDPQTPSPKMYFRGKELTGAEVDLADYVGVVLSNPHADDDELELPHREAKFPFSKMTVWHEGGFSEERDPLAGRLTEMLKSSQALADL